MKLTQNMVLIILICLLLILLSGIETSNMLSIPQNVQKNITQNKSIKQAINIEIIWGISPDTRTNANKIKQSKNIITNIINRFPSRINLIIKTLGTKKLPLHLTATAQNNNKQKLTRFFNQIKSINNYSLKNSLSQAKNKLQTASGSKHIILVTDGYKVKQILSSSIINQLNKVGIRIHVVQVGNIKPKPQARLKSLVELGGGRYFTYFEENKIISTLNLY